MDKFKGLNDQELAKEYLNFKHKIIDNKRQLKQGYYYILNGSKQRYLLSSGDRRELINWIDEDKGILKNYKNEAIKRGLI